jgi:hypothetical protein
MGEAMRICCVTADLSDDDLDLPGEPGVILRGTVASVKLSAMLWGEPVDVVAVHDLAHRENLIRRAHDAMSRREPDGIGNDEWDQLVADMGKEIGVTA